MCTNQVSKWSVLTSRHDDKQLCLNPAEDSSQHQHCEDCSCLPLLITVYYWFMCYKHTSQQRIEKVQGQKIQPMFRVPRCLRKSMGAVSMLIPKNSKRRNEATKIVIAHLLGIFGLKLHEHQQQDFTRVRSAVRYPCLYLHLIYCIYYFPVLDILLFSPQSGDCRRIFRCYILHITGWAHLFIVTLIISYNPLILIVSLGFGFLAHALRPRLAPAVNLFPSWI